MMLQLIKRIIKYSETDRVKRVVEICARGENATPMEFLELTMIQSIRQENPQATYTHCESGDEHEYFDKQVFSHGTLKKCKLCEFEWFFTNRL